MPLTPTATRVGLYSVKYEWSGTAPYYVYLDGAPIVNGTDMETITVQTTDGSTNPLPAIEVLDDTDTITAQSVKYSPRLRMQWRGQSDASLYLVQQSDGAGNWTTIQAVRESGQGYYAYETTAQIDGTDAEFQILPQDSRGYQGVPIGFTLRMVCNPRPPAVTYSYSAGTLTAEAV